MGEVVVRLVEEHVAQPAAEDHAEHAVDQDVVHVARRHAVAQALAHAQLAEGDHEYEREDIHEPVPANGERAPAEEDGIELRVDEHGLP